MIFFAPLLFALPVSALSPQIGSEFQARLPSGIWRAELASPGGPLPFGLELQQLEPTADKPQVTWRGVVTNGEERIEIPIVSYKDGELTLRFDHYDSEIVARPTSERARELVGQWSKRGPDGVPSTLPFRATYGEAPRFEGIGVLDPTAVLAPRFRVLFAEEREPAVGIFELSENGEAHGTFLTTVGDYRFLAGTYEGGRLRLSCFDGAHAFLFDAVASRDGALRGDFWSRDSYHTTWIATPDDKIELPDPFSISRWNEKVTLESMAFTERTENGNGKRASLGEARFDGKARILQVFGTWCPNCHDETQFLKELYERYAEEGLAIAAVAFELTGNSRKDLEQLGRYTERMEIPYPVLYGGVWNKEKASMMFGGLDRIHAYPTTIFFDRDDRPVAVYTGFTGPAAPIAHERLRSSFDRIIRALIAGEEPPIGTPKMLGGKDKDPAQERSQGKVK